MPFSHSVPVIFVAPPHGPEGLDTGVQTDSLASAQWMAATLTRWDGVMAKADFHDDSRMGTREEKGGAAALYHDSPQA